MEHTTFPPPTLEDFPQITRQARLQKYVGGVFAGMFAGIGVLHIATGYQDPSYMTWFGPFEIATGGAFYALGSVITSRLAKKLSKLTAPIVQKELSFWFGHQFAARIESPLPSDALRARIAYYLWQSRMPVTYDSPQRISSLAQANLRTETIDAKLQEGPRGTVVDLVWFGGSSAYKNRPDDLLAMLIA